MSVDSLRETIQTLSQRKETLDLACKDLQTRVEKENDPDKKQALEILAAFALASHSYCNQLENLWIASFALKNQLETLKEMILSTPFIKDDQEVSRDLDTIFKKYDPTH